MKTYTRLLVAAQRHGRDPITAQWFHRDVEQAKRNKSRFAGWLLDKWEREEAAEATP